MAAIFCDGFDHYATADITQKWTQISGVSVIIDPTNGRRGGGALNLNNSALGITPTAPVPSGNTYVIGFAYRRGEPFGSDGLVGARLTGAHQVWLQLRTDGTLAAIRGGTLLGPTTFALQQNVWAYIELKVVLHPSAGSVIVRVNNVPWLTLSGINTQGAGAATWNEMGFGAPFTGGFNALYGRIDDLYVLDGTGSNNNDFLGDSRVDVIYPNAAGASSQFTRFPVSVADQWATIDETAPNGDTDYNESATPTHRDSLNFPDAPATGAPIRFIQALASAKKTDAGSADLTVSTRVGGVYYDGTALALSEASYNYVRQIWPVNPATGAAWIDSGINAAEFGYFKSA